MRMAEYGHSRSTAQPSVQRSVEPGGAFSSRKCLSPPQEPSCVQSESASQRMMSRSWHAFARIMGLVSSSRRQLPRTNEWAKRSEEHTSELQSRGHLVCRLHLEKKKFVTLV